MHEDLRLRLSKLLAEDKEVNESCKQAFLNDLAKIAAEYFELDGDPSLQFETKKDGLHVEFSFRARRARNFTVIK